MTVGWCVLAAVLVGCTCGEGDRVVVAPPAEAPAPPEPAPPEPPAAEPARPEPPPPDPAEARAFRAKLREARAEVRANHPTEAYVLFGALVRERPSEAWLRCEAGYVVYLAHRLDDAERDIAAAIESWSTPPLERDRAPLAMCLYNRGLVALDRGNTAAAAEAWTRSLELRPNETVQRRLDDLEHERDTGTSDGEAPTVAALIGELPRAHSLRRRRRVHRADHAPRSGRVALESLFDAR